MSTFLDGPAAGVTLELRRAPLLLRVVHWAGGDFDALDQLDDIPEPHEEIVVYRLTSQPSRYHQLCRGQHKARSGWWESGEYRLLEVQPTDDECRTFAAWSAWCNAHKHLVADLLRPTVDP